MIWSPDYLSVLLQAWFFKLPIYWLFYRGLAASGLASALHAQTRTGEAFKIAGLVFLTSVCIHPLVFFGFMASGKTYLWSALWGEVFAVAGEGLLQSWAARLPLRRTLSASFIANLVSWQVTPLVIYWLYY